VNVPLENMKVLIVASTAQELGTLNSKLSDIQVTTLVSGVGMMQTTYNLSNFLGLHTFDLVINIGICGAFHTFKKGEIVFVKEDSLGTFGADDNGTFLPFTNFIDSSEFENRSNITNSDTLNTLSKVKSTTVDTVSGSEKVISALVKEFNPAIETMEGAAGFYVCNKHKTPCIQIRAVSNLVEERNTENWDIELALFNLHQLINTVLTELNG
jgi:futalosine hydrolase